MRRTQQLNLLFGNALLGRRQRESQNCRPDPDRLNSNLMHLRALRAEVDVKLAIGEFTIDQAADYLEKIVPVDRATARQEAVFFASSPGQAITYQIGKTSNH